MILTEQQVRNYLFQAGFSGQALDYAVQIARCESGWNTDAQLVTSFENSKGLMQINVRGNPQYSSYDLFNPLINAQVAFEMYLARGNFYDWTCARNLGLVNPKGNDTGTTTNILVASLIGISIYLLLRNA